MGARVIFPQDTDTTFWGGAAMLLSLFALIGASDLLMQALIAILFPCVGWTILYFIKREVTYRFPAKTKRRGKKLEEGKDNITKELE